MRGIKWFMILTALALAALAVYLLIPQTPSSPPPVETESIKSEDALPAPASSQPALPQAETEAPQQVHHPYIISVPSLRRIQLTMLS